MSRADLHLIRFWVRSCGCASTESCRRLSEYSGIPLTKVLAACGHAPTITESAVDTWPDFRDYASKKYGGELDDDIITMVEELIERRRGRRSGRDAG